MRLNKDRVKHGASVGGKSSPEYDTWKNVKNRCFNKNNPAYSHYGGRGIGMHEPWARSFEEFFAYVGEKPGAGYSIDRIDNNQGYYPGNVRWATAREQVLNRRTTVYINGRLLVDVAQETGIPLPTLYSRVQRGQEPLPKKPRYRNSRGVYADARAQGKFPVDMQPLAH